MTFIALVHLGAEAHPKSLYCHFNPVLGGDINSGSFSMEEDSNHKIMIQLSMNSGDDFGVLGTAVQSGKVVVARTSLSNGSVFYFNESEGLEVIVVLFEGHGKDARALITGQFKNQKNKETLKFSGQFICHK